MLGGLLGWGQATQAAELALDEGGDAVQVVKEVDGGTETVRGHLPMVVTTDLRLNEPRYASLPNIVRAKKKKLEKVALDSYGPGLEPRLEVLEVCGELLPLLSPLSSLHLPSPALPLHTLPLSSSPQQRRWWVADECLGQKNRHHDRAAVRWPMWTAWWQS